MPNMFLLVIQIAVILVASQVMGALFRKMRQPQVIGEMVAGILLGPSLLGWLAPGLSAALFPPDSLGYLAALSQLGLILFMFLVGLGVSVKELRAHGYAAMLTSNASIVTPFILAAALAVYLYPRLSIPGVSFSGFALFLGAAMSVTAFPVLARILTERNLLKTKTGSLAIACAAFDDVSGWCILAYIVILVRSGESSMSVWLAPLGFVAFAAFMVFFLRRRLRSFESSFLKDDKLGNNAVVLVLLLILGSALVTEALGMHLLFGAFLAGVIMPRSRQLSEYLHQKFESLTLLLLLPLFFATTGLRTRIDLIEGARMWFYCGLIVAVAIAGKLGGSLVAARIGGMSWRDSAALGVLLNTRGLMELVILNVGLEIRVISPTVFSMMVLMALITTFMTSPILQLIYPTRPRLTEAADKRKEQVQVA